MSNKNDSSTNVQETSESPQGSSSPAKGLGYVEQVQQLLKLPQHLCKQRGICCKVATYKGSLSWEEIQALATDPEADGHESARDFASIFIPYPSQTAVREIADEFVDRVRQHVERRGDDPDKITFAHCKYVLEDGRCGVHEDRPLGCRMYPFPHKNTIFHPGCGFEAQGVENWHKIEGILAELSTLEETLRPTKKSDA